MRGGHDLAIDYDGDLVLRGSRANSRDRSSVQSFAPSGVRCTSTDQPTPNWDPNAACARATSAASTISGPRTYFAPLRGGPTTRTTRLRSSVETRHSLKAPSCSSHVTGVFFQSDEDEAIIFITCRTSNFARCDGVRVLGEDVADPGRGDGESFGPAHDVAASASMSTTTRVKETCAPSPMTATQ